MFSLSYYVALKDYLCDLLLSGAFQPPLFPNCIEICLSQKRLEKTENIRAGTFFLETMGAN